MEELNVQNENEVEQAVQKARVWRSLTAEEQEASIAEYERHREHAEGFSRTYVNLIELIVRETKESMSDNELFKALRVAEDLFYEYKFHAGRRDGEE